MGGRSRHHTGLCTVFLKPGLPSITMTTPARSFLRGVSMLAEKTKKEKQSKDTIILTVAQTDKLIEEYRRGREQAWKDREECLSLCRECKEKLRGKA